MNRHVKSTRLAGAVFLLTMHMTPFVGAQDPPAPAATNANASSEATDAPIDRQAALDAAVNWTKGPGAGPLGTHSKIAIPASFRFADSSGTQKMLQMMENTTSGDELGMVGPDDLDWFVVFEWDDVG